MITKNVFISIFLNLVPTVGLEPTPQGLEGLRAAVKRQGRLLVGPFLAVGWHAAADSGSPIVVVMTCPYSGSYRVVTVALILSSTLANRRNPTTANISTLNAVCFTS